jgi:mRNA interferase MazF
MAARASWCPDRRDMIWIDCHPLMVLSPREFNERTGIVIGLPKSFDWRARRAKPHPLKKVPKESFALACETLNQIIDIG